MNNQQSLFSIVTPSFNQLDWLRLCVASVRDQVPAEGIVDPSLSIVHSDQQSAIGNQQSPCGQSSIPPLAVEHIIQDAGSPGIEDFAREVGADFYRDGVRIADCSLSIDNSNQQSTINDQRSRYRIAVHCEADAGMYDAISRGFSKSTGEFFSWLNCDEQYLPGALQKAQSEWNRAPGADYLIFGAVVLDRHLKYLCTRLLPKAFEAQLWSGALGYFSCSTFFRRSALAKRRRLFSGQLRSASDVILFLRLSRRCRGRWVRDVTSVFVDHGKNLNLSALAAREVRAIGRRQPRLSRCLLKPATWAYKLKKLLWGSYRPPNVPVEIHTLSSPGTRRAVACRRTNWRWSTYRIDA